MRDRGETGSEKATPHMPGACRYQACVEMEMVPAGTHEKKACHRRKAAGQVAHCPPSTAQRAG